jgi:hypothetical protein
MRLVDLDPRWLVRDGRCVGFIFKSPTKPHWYQSCMLAPTPIEEQWDLFNMALADSVRDGQEPEWMYTCVQACRAECGWRIESGSEFHDLTVKPSIDGSAGGLWHGFITNGGVA